MSDRTPEDIYRESFSIVEEKLGPRTGSAEEREVIKRVAHASADVSFARRLVISEGAVAAGIRAVRAGKNILTDVEMVRAGVRKAAVEAAGGETLCFLRDAETAEIAGREGITRSAAAMRLAAPLIEGGIVAIGNAPTALFELCRLIDASAARPALVVGVPIGFVGAAESKRELLKRGVPCITNRGRRGGSAIAAAVVNAVISLAQRGDGSDATRQLGTTGGLKRGYTTGTCAQAASRAAALMLVRQSRLDRVEVRLPAGAPLSLAVHDQELTPDRVRCSVVKDAGDDPDVTDGIKVFSEVRWSDREGVVIEGGLGIGRVTRPGLAVPVGEPAVNPTPRAMIERDLTEILPPERGFHVTLSIPGGEKLASRTWNPRLGIEGGLSIIGTTGIVEPKSTAAYTASIDAAIGMAAALDPRTVFLVPGYVGERAVSTLLAPPSGSVVRVGDHVGFSLEACAARSVGRIVLAGHVGKVAKVAAGLFDTHSRAGDARLETLAACAAAEGADAGLVREILDLDLAEASVEILESRGFAGAFRLVAERAARRSAALIEGRSEVAVMVLDLEGRFLGGGPGDLERLDGWKRFSSSE